MKPRLRLACEAPARPERSFVLYWMTSSRRPTWNFALDRAVDWARELAKPLVVLEALRRDHPWASDRIHRFVEAGMARNERAFAKTDALYFPYVEPEPGAGRGLLRTLAADSCVVVTDTFPCFFLPRMVAAAARAIDVRLEEVDGNGLLPLQAADRDYPTAYAFRRFLQKVLPDHLEHVPRAQPLRARLPRGRLPKGILSQWPRADLKPTQIPDPFEVWRRFRTRRLAAYPEARNRPEENGTSGLSPYLHFGHISAHQMVRDITRQEGWTLDDLAPTARGARQGWWGMSEAAEAYLDQLVTWRELGFNMCAQRKDYDRYESLPDWAQKTLGEHERDVREHLYGLQEFEEARTHDPLWNAAQRQLVREGRIHGYLRMLWGKKILEWSESPRVALETMIELNNKYALDGRDPNSYSGIFWVLGRYDRPWGPERPVFGKVRFMSSANTARKFPVKDYIARHGD